MKLTINFSSTLDLITWLSSLTPAQTRLMGLMSSGDIPNMPATVTPEKQEAARASTKLAVTPAAEKSKAAEKPSDAFVKSGIGALVIDAQIANAAAVAGLLTLHGGLIGGKPNAAGLKPESYDAVIAGLKEIISNATPAEASAPVPKTYEDSGLKEFIGELQKKTGFEKGSVGRQKMVDTIMKLGGVDEEGKIKASNIPPENFDDAFEQLKALEQA